VLPSVLFPVLVLSTVGRFLEWRPLRRVGGLSYSLYLWQELFLPELASERAHNGFRYLQQGPWNVLAILACAILSRYLMEIPMNRLGQRLSEAMPPLRLSGPTPALN
jgi:peptidoglycan/LPS O-acetylase OafA/YrhL